MRLYVLYVSPYSMYIEPLQLPFLLPAMYTFLHWPVFTLGSVLYRYVVYVMPLCYNCTKF
jgi:hypothetical protein